jgi:hypothetical protein
MFWTITVILLVLWVLGMTAGSTVGMWVHLMLVFALVSMVLALVSGARRSGGAAGTR